MSEDGKAAEAMAAAWLVAKGLKVIARNYRCRFGEIDLIMQDGKTTVFTEVRLRASQLYGGAAASVSGQKQRRLIAAAHHYLSQQHGDPLCRFDVVTLSRLEPSAIEWIKDAFGA